MTQPTAASLRAAEAVRRHLNDYRNPTTVEAFAGIIDEAIKSDISILSALTDAQRVELFSRFCVHCGSADPKCQCWNDE